MLAMAAALFLATLVAGAAAHSPGGSIEWKSGLMEVNKTDGSRMFYVYTPPQNGNASSPHVLWLQGGPGASGLVGFFFEIGPYQLAKTTQGELELVPRAASWSGGGDMGVIFVDNPVGTGYSTAGSPGGYSTTEDEVSENLYNLLQSFYDLYPDTAHSPLYIVGESYGGHYAPNLAVYIAKRNQKAQAQGVRVLPLAGLGVQDGLTDPEVQELVKPTAAYHFGLLDLKQLAEAQSLAGRAVALAHVGKYEEARDTRLSMEEFIRNCSGVNLLDVREFGDFQFDELLEKWANDPDNKASLNVPPDVQFNTDPQVIEALKGDLMRSYAAQVREVLDTYKLPVILFQGQFDLKDGPAGNEAWIRRLNWSGQQKFLQAPRVRWYVGDDPDQPAGWAQEAGLLTQVVVAGAGHLGPMTQPVRILDLITRWTQGRSFTPPSSPSSPSPTTQLHSLRGSLLLGTVA